MISARPGERSHRESSRKSPAMKRIAVCVCLSVAAGCASKSGPNSGARDPRMASPNDPFTATWRFSPETDLLLTAATVGASIVLRKASSRLRGCHVRRFGES